MADAVELEAVLQAAARRTMVVVLLQVTSETASAAATAGVVLVRVVAMVVVMAAVRGAAQAPAVEAVQTAGMEALQVVQGAWAVGVAIEVERVAVVRVVERVASRGSILHT